MTRKAKAFAVGLTAVLATCVAAQAVQAAEFHKPAEPITITMRPDGTGKTAHQVFDFAGASLTCGGAVGEATVEGAATTFSEFQSSLLVEVATCSFLGQKAEVKLSANCGWVFHSNGTADIKCGGGEELTISVPTPFCHITVPGQSGNGSVSFSNIGAPTEMTMQATVTGTKYTATGAGCPIAGTFSNGIWTTGNVIFKGEKKGTAEQVSLSFG